MFITHYSIRSSGIHAVLKIDSKSIDSVGLTYLRNICNAMQTTRTHALKRWAYTLRWLGPQIFLTIGSEKL